MEKQENSKTEEALQDKYNKTTIFLTKFIFGENFDIFKKTGYIDSYVDDPEITKIVTLGEKQRLLFLLFKNKKLTIKSVKNIIKQLSTIPVEVVFSYELVNDCFIVVIDFPEKYIKDYDNIVEGRYSKLSEEFMSKFPSTREVFNSNGDRMGKESTIYYHIFHRTDWLKELWMKKLGLVELDDKLELWSKPNNQDLIFNINKIIK